MSKRKKYKKTLLACYLGFVVQAIAANFAPLLYLNFHRTYGISLGRIALISTCFFFTQIVVDFVCIRIVDRIGYRTCIIIAEITSGFGLAGLAFLPDLLPSPFLAIILCVITYALGSGLTEVLGSPIVEACPFENKEGMMSLLHSFYCWGSVGVVLLSTLFFTVFGIENWRVLACLWAIIPFYNIYNFATCPIEKLVEDGQGISMKELFKSELCGQDRLVFLRLSFQREEQHCLHCLHLQEIWEALLGRLLSEVYRKKQEKIYRQACWLELDFQLYSYSVYLY